MRPVRFALLLLAMALPAVAAERHDTLRREVPLAAGAGRLVVVDNVLGGVVVRAGAVEISGVRGRVRAGNVNGPLRLSGLAGEVRASTVNGGIRACYAAAPSAAGRFQTVNGEIELELPAASSADIELETMNGELWSDFEVRALARESKAGRDGRSYRLERDTVVRIGDGGPRFECQTLNGDIVLRAR